jgi:hypothetical protein
MDPLTPTGRYLFIAVIVALLALLVMVVSAQRSELPQIQPDADGTTPTPSVLPQAPEQSPGDVAGGARDKEGACCAS